MINYNFNGIFKCMKKNLEIFRYVDNQNHDVNNIVNSRNNLELLKLPNFVSICFSCIKAMKLVIIISSFQIH
jgi:hypothetical protein